MKRIGIYAGTFDPVHKGHLAFAEAAVKQAHLDEVIFLPERSPRHKHGRTSFAHRVAMLKQTLKDYPDMQVMELADEQFTVGKTLLELQQAFPSSAVTLVFLMGSDIVGYLPTWPQADLLLASCELVVGLRSGANSQQVIDTILKWPLPPTALTVISNEDYQTVSSSRIRSTLIAGQKASEVPDTALAYIAASKLYCVENSD